MWSISWNRSRIHCSWEWNPGLPLRPVCDHDFTKIEIRAETFSKVVIAMERMVAAGESLASVARQFPNLFSQVAVGLLEAGEGSGSLDESFRSIRVLVARYESIRHQARMMILQPSITFLTAIVTVGIIIVYIVPQFLVALGLSWWKASLANGADDFDQRGHHLSPL